MELNISISKAKPKSRATAWVFVYDQRAKQFLVLKRAPHTNNPNLWNIPGGGTDGKHPEKGAKRELMEEAGLRVRRSELIHIGRIEGLDADYFLVILPGRPLLQIDSAESSDHRWLSLEDILKLKSTLHKKTAVPLRDTGILAAIERVINPV